MAAPLPELCVMDLDMCMWEPETFTLGEIPTKTVIGDLNGEGEGVVGVISDGQTFHLFEGALAALQEIYHDKFPGMRLAAASSADNSRAVQIAKKAMTMLEIVPGVTMYDLFHRGWEDDGNIQIGRSPPLSSDKAASHFPILHKNTGVGYEKMLFFDDCNWGDSCAKVAKRWGVVTQRTPNGMTLEEFHLGLKKYREARS